MESEIWIPMNNDEFSDLYREHLPSLSRFLVRRVPVSQVDDLASDIIEIAWKKRDQAPSGQELAWLYKIASYVVANYRAKTNNRNRIQGLLLPPQNAPSAESIALSDKDLALAWSKLKNSDQQIIALSSFEQLSIEEIAVTLSISKNAVSIRLHRAKATLEKHLHALEGADDER